MLNFNLYFLLGGVFETVIDACILALSVRAVFGVQLPLKTRVSVTSIVLLGGLLAKTFRKIFSIEADNYQYHRDKYTSRLLYVSARHYSR
jgi:hypothetical protein